MQIRGASNKLGARGLTARVCEMLLDVTRLFPFLTFFGNDFSVSSSSMFSCEEIRSQVNNAP